MWSNASKLSRYLSHFFVERPEDVRVFALGIQEDQPDDLRPEPLFIIDKPIDRS